MGELRVGKKIRTKERLLLRNKKALTTADSVLLLFQGNQGLHVDSCAGGPPSPHLKMEIFDLEVSLEAFSVFTLDEMTGVQKVLPRLPRSIKIFLYGGFLSSGNLADRKGMKSSTL